MRNNDRSRFPDGSLVQKVSIGAGDLHPVGAKGRIAKYFGGVNHPVSKKYVHGYMVQWESGGPETLIFDDGRLSMLQEMN